MKSSVLMAIFFTIACGMAHLPAVPADVLSLDGDDWLLAPDPSNVGRDESWFTEPRADARRTKVPWIIQDVFPGYHGVAWYWRQFQPPPNTDPEGHCLVRFWAIDYKADVWLNGVWIGEHEGGEAPFVLDITAAIKPNERNLLAIRVINPTHEFIDGIVLNETPHRNKALPYGAGSAWNQGGIIDSVELLLVPAVWIEDLHADPDLSEKTVHLSIQIRNMSSAPVAAAMELAIAPAASGATCATQAVARQLAPGDSVIDATIPIENPRPWNLNDPFLYRATARVTASAPKVFAEHSVRFGFRDFRFKDGAFCLNGRRIYLRSSHTGNCCPIGLELPHDPDLLRRDLINAKTMGFNAIRFIAGVAKRYQLDLCDEIGLMVYEECYAAWCLADSVHMPARFRDATLAMVRRDRNHPSVVIWGLLNETPEGNVLQQAVEILPDVRKLDRSRMVMLNSGRWDLHSRAAAGNAARTGSLSNPGSPVWEDILSDQHPYQRVPHTASIIHALRTMDGGGMPLFISEYGIGSAVDLVRAVRHYERLKAENVEDYQFYRTQLDRFMEDWAKWRMAEVFNRPEDFFTQSNARMASQRLLGLNAIRSNPAVVGYSLTGTVDQGMTGEGLWTTFRELKPGTFDAVFDGFAPLRLCLFVEPVNVYRGMPARFEAVLANEDALAPGEYPVHLFAVGPGSMRIFDHTITVTIPEAKGDLEPPFAFPIFSEEIQVDGPAGRYRFLASFERGAAAAGGDVEFYVDDDNTMPPVGAEIVLFGDDPGLAEWLGEHGIRHRPFAMDPVNGREVILASGTPPADADAAFTELARRLARGSAAVFLAPSVFAEKNRPTAFVPLANKGTVAGLPSWLYHKDEWAKRHPIFDELPAGGLMDYTFYREIIPDTAWIGLDPPSEAVAGGNNAAQGYSSGLFVAAYNLGAGQFILNTLSIRENLGSNPVAERLLRNMLRYASRDRDKPLAELPDDFDQQLDAFGYRGQ
ncbi:MAG: hypothetical protein JW829_10560 [Pirellulales bacterium]|nr:hypothetical protein [Pirellulales bacterium]